MSRYLLNTEKIFIVECQLLTRVYMNESLNQNHQNYTTNVKENSGTYKKKLTLLYGYRQWQHKRNTAKNFEVHIPNMI